MNRRELGEMGMEIGVAVIGTAIALKGSEFLQRKVSELVPEPEALLDGSVIALQGIQFMDVRGQILKKRRLSEKKKTI